MITNALTLIASTSKYIFLLSVRDGVNNLISLQHQNDQNTFEIFTKSSDSQHRHYDYLYCNVRFTHFCKLKCGIDCKLGTQDIT